jgi:hypothetical protein
MVRIFKKTDLMKKSNYLFRTFVLLAALLVSISSFAQKGKLYGKKFDTKKTISVAELKEQMGGKKEMPVVIEGTISEVCQAEGCWMKLSGDEGDLFVKFKDHAFVIPKDLSGHKSYVSGIAVQKTVTIEEQRHFAEDAGKTADEIAQITEPKTEVRVNATGVVIE